jgi:hypothetical protein
MGPALDRWVREGIRSVATFVPWQAAEADISHLLPRFLTEAIERKIQVSLILTPEVGMNYSNSGVPRPLMAKSENVARDAEGRAFPQVLAPGVHELASLSAPELLKRWHGTLGRIDAILADIERTYPHAGDFVQAVVTGSFWKHYRSPEQSAFEPFAGECVDHGNAAKIHLRNRIEQVLGSREFTDVQSGAPAIQWKSRMLEGVHRRWVSQQSEEVFRNRAAQGLGRRSRTVSVRQVDMISPEADAALAWSSLLQGAGVEGRNFLGLARVLDAHLDRMAAAGTEVSGEAVPWVQWSGMGGFGRLADSEKQFLILKALLSTGTRGGCVLVDESEWDSLSPSFRARTEALSRTLAQGELKLQEKALYLTPHLWSSPSESWKFLRTQLGREVRLVSSLDLALSRPEVRLIWVDPQWIFNRETMMRLLEWSGDDRVLVLPRDALMTASARRMCDDAMRGSAQRAIRINRGVPCDIHPAGTGKVLFASLPESARLLGLQQPACSTEELTGFVSGVLNLADIKPSVQVTDVRIDLVPAQRVDYGMGLFVLNAHDAAVQADLQFGEAVLVSDFARLMANASGLDRPEIAPSTQFSLEVPPRGVLPIAVFGTEFGWESETSEVSSDRDAQEQSSDSASGVRIEEVWEEVRRVEREAEVARSASGDLAREVDFAAVSELHGFAAEEGRSAEMPF